MPFASAECSPVRTEEQKLDAGPDIQEHSQFATDISMNKETLVVGSFVHHMAGIVYFFENGMNGLLNVGV